MRNWGQQSLCNRLNSEETNCSGLLFFKKKKTKKAGKQAKEVSLPCLHSVRYLLRRGRSKLTSLPLPGVGTLSRLCILPGSDEGTPDSEKQTSFQRSGSCWRQQGCYWSLNLPKKKKGSCTLYCFLENMGPQLLLWHLTKDLVYTMYNVRQRNARSPDPLVRAEVEG